MARIRIAQKGWNVSSAAETPDEILVGVRCMWVEIDGCRITDVISANVRVADDSATAAVLETRVYGPIELVYLLADGTEVSRFIEPSELPTMDFKTVTAPELLHESECDVAKKAARDVLGDETTKWVADLVVDRLHALGYLIRPQGD